MNPAPHWYSVEGREGVSLHHLIARLGRTQASLTTYRLGDGLRQLAEAENAGVPLRHTAIVNAVSRSHDGQWRLQVSCPRCGTKHVHGAGMCSAPAFGLRQPPCGGAAYYVRID